MKFVKEIKRNNRPRPGPLPGRGSGKRTVCFLPEVIRSIQSRLFCETAYDSPSPGGEGRGEGGRNN